MNNFIQLSPPFKESVLSMWAGKWFVGAVDVNDGFLLNDGSNEMVQGAQNEEDNEHLYFEYEARAHAIAAQYYLMHGLTYPYQDEWEESLEDVPEDKIADVLITTSQVSSQVMKFI